RQKCGAVGLGIQVKGVVNVGVFGIVRIVVRAVDAIPEWLVNADVVETTQSRLIAEKQAGLEPGLLRTNAIAPANGCDRKKVDLQTGVAVGGLEIAVGGQIIEHRMIFGGNRIVEGNGVVGDVIKPDVHVNL